MRIYIVTLSNVVTLGFRIVATIFVIGKTCKRLLETQNESI